MRLMKAIFEETRLLSDDDNGRCEVTTGSVLSLTGLPRPRARPEPRVLAASRHFKGQMVGSGYLLACREQLESVFPSLAGRRDPVSTVFSLQHRRRVSTTCAPRSPDLIL
ncbi:hypothetical protein Bbelb_071440 [Branchiostoma belcheri]|nr:hypothetical protein Bbelb_071440 [Branchiostoma belcheri]